jgi:hypothetical protein
MPFEIHGRISIEPQGDILSIVAEGPFNVEAVVEFRYELEALIQTFQGRSFGELIELVDQPLFVPEALKELASSLQNEVAQGACCYAFFLHNPMYRNFFSHEVMQIFALSSVPHEIFSNMDEARSWLRSELEQLKAD